jgi:hypothetical protein
MTDDDENAAVLAMVEWFRSQGINPAESITIMAKGLIFAVTCLVNLKIEKGEITTSDEIRRDVDEGLEIISDTIRNTRLIEVLVSHVPPKGKK